FSTAGIVSGETDIAGNSDSVKTLDFDKPGLDGVCSGDVDDPNLAGSIGLGFGSNVENGGPGSGYVIVPDQSLSASVDEPNAELPSDYVIIPDPTIDLNSNAQISGGIQVGLSGSGEADINVPEIETPSF
ncbi:hypothetical protein, partial [Salmonella sp. s55004]|uniref:hypothetical protein n=1 Tax=Salmonella sp. s55004 TaxID=3159675 RepID=UPI00397F6668